MRMLAVGLLAALSGCGMMGNIERTNEAARVAAEAELEDRRRNVMMELEKQWLDEIEGDLRRYRDGVREGQ